ncbi:hypothetical protein ACVWZ1_002752, partial [Thermostichus sp. MS-CIW-25]
LIQVLSQYTYMEAGFPPGTKPAAMVRASSPKIGEIYQRY